MILVKTKNGNKYYRTRETVSLHESSVSVGFSGEIQDSAGDILRSKGGQSFVLEGANYDDQLTLEGLYTRIDEVLSFADIDGHLNP